ncbi:MAG: hypothetical protein ACI9SP_002127 [Arenicella sp.]|jgi:hypothetical protein
MKPCNVSSSILILEDDLDQMEFLVSLIRAEIKKVMSNQSTSDK